MNKNRADMRIKDLIEKSGIPRSTIHYYLRQGLLHPPIKTGHTMAYYDDTHLESLKQIQHMKNELGMSIGSIRKQLKKMISNRATLSQLLATDPEITADMIGLRDRRIQETMDAAIQVFTEKGYHNTKIKDIAEALGISTSTFYIYFKNKRDLFIAVVDDVIKKVLGSTAESIKKEKDYQKRLRLRMEAFFNNYIRYSEILYQLRAEMSHEKTWPKQTIHKMYHQLTKPIIRETKQAIKEGEIRPIDPDLFAYALTGLIEAMSMRTTMDKKYKLEDIGLFLKDLLSEGIYKDK